jgi:hypothetical protein
MYLSLPFNGQMCVCDPDFASRHSNCAGIHNGKATFLCRFHVTHPHRKTPGPRSGCPNRMLRTGHDISSGHVNFKCFLHPWVFIRIQGCTKISEHQIIAIPARSDITKHSTPHAPTRPHTHTHTK